MSFTSDSDNDLNDSHCNIRNSLEPLLSNYDRNDNHDDIHSAPDETETNNKNIVFPKWFRCITNDSVPPPRLNHNVFLALLLSVLEGISDSIWSGTVMVAYLKRLGNDRNGPVGNVEAVGGLASLISALPVGYLADHYGRSKVIAFGGILLVVTAILHSSLLAWIGVDESSLTPHKIEISFYLMAVIMFFWGIGGGIVDGPTEALFADSTPAGSRSKYYMYLFTCYTLASCLGPLVSIILFQTIGDDWDLFHLRIVLYVGLGLTCVNATIMMFFDDSKALDEPEDDEESDDICVAHEHNQSHDQNRSDKEEDATEYVSFMESLETDTPAIVIENNLTDKFEHNLKKRRRWIPYIIFLSDAIFAIGSGMTVKFFPLFFMDEVGMSPSQVQIIYVIIPIAMVISSSLGTSLASSGFGRVQSCILLEVMGVSALFVMVFVRSQLDVHPFILAPIYIARTALINASSPISESVLMDFVPKNERARWKSLDSVTAFGWCGSAALGGFLSDRFDYTYTFLITAILQSVGVLIFALLIPLVPRNEKDLS